MEPRPESCLTKYASAFGSSTTQERTEKSYVYWIRRYILFHYKQHPKNMGSAEIQAFLTRLAVEEHVAASTQKQALNAVVFCSSTP
jgi:hypothetical protein